MNSQRSFFFLSKMILNVHSPPETEGRAKPLGHNFLRYLIDSHPLSTHYPYAELQRHRGLQHEQIPAFGVREGSKFCGFGLRNDRAESTPGPV
jgi:hypothetical protein